MHKTEVRQMQNKIDDDLRLLIHYVRRLYPSNATVSFISDQSILANFRAIFGTRSFDHVADTVENAIHWYETHERACGAAIEED